MSIDGTPTFLSQQVRYKSASEVTRARRNNANVAYYNNSPQSQKAAYASTYTSFRSGVTSLSGYIPSTGTAGLPGFTTTPASSNFASWNYVSTNMTPTSGTLTTSGTFTSIQGVNGLNIAQVYSSTGYTSNVYISTQHKSSIPYGYFGLSRNPSSGGITGSAINYGFYFNGAADVHMCELTTNPVGTFTAAWTSNDVFKITYDGVNVNYYCNTSLLRTVAAAPGTPFYVNAIPYINGAQFVNLTIGTFTPQVTVPTIFPYTYTKSFVQASQVGEKATPNMMVARNAVVNNPQ